MSNVALIMNLNYCIEKTKEYLDKNNIRYENKISEEIVFDEYYHEQIFTLGELIEPLSNGELDVKKYGKYQAVDLVIKIGECLEQYLKNHGVDCDFGKASEGKESVKELVEKLDKVVLNNDR